MFRSSKLPQVLSAMPSLSAASSCCLHYFRVDPDPRTSMRIQRKVKTYMML
jgi:hypothetical protein